MRKIPELTEMGRTVKRAGDLEGVQRRGAKPEGGVEDETCEDRPTGAGLLHLKKICTRET